MEYAELNWLRKDEEATKLQFQKIIALNELSKISFSLWVSLSFISH